MKFEPVFRFHTDDFKNSMVKRTSILREYNIYKPILSEPLSFLELTQIEILINEIFKFSKEGVHHFTLKEKSFSFWLYLSRFPLEKKDGI